MGKSTYARASFSEKAAALFSDPETRREIIRQILAGARKIKVAGAVFARKATSPAPEGE